MGNTSTQPQADELERQLVEQEEELAVLQEDARELQAHLAANKLRLANKLPYNEFREAQAERARLTSALAEKNNEIGALKADVKDLRRAVYGAPTQAFPLRKEEYVFLEILKGLLSSEAGYDEDDATLIERARSLQQMALKCMRPAIPPLPVKEAPRG